VRSGKLIAKNVHRIAKTRRNHRNGRTESDMENGILSVERQPAANPMTHLQQQVGNRAVNRMLNDHTLQRQIEEPAAEAEENDQPIHTSGLGKEERLPGHGNTGSSRTADVPEIQLAPGDVTATISLTSNSPLEISMPAADIAANHGRPGVAGWTTPHYDIQVLSARTRLVNINVTMDYDIELAEEFSGDTLRVLRDHEFGHVNIGNQKAQQHLVNELKGSLESQSALSRTNIQAAIDTAAANFEAQEGAGSQAYDSMDYPRMEQAYLGARTPLADLETRSGNIATLASALRTFNTLGEATPEARIGRQAQAVLDAVDGLSEDELAQLQYNAGFASLVARCRSNIGTIVERYHWDFWIIEFSTLDQDVRQKLDELRAALDGFTWRSPV
jgi:hypothetical protein